MMSNKKFSDEEFLKLYSLGLSDRQIAEKFKSSRSTVRVRRFKLNLYPNFVTYQTPANPTERYTKFKKMWRINSKKWNVENPERVKENRKNYYQENKEKCNENYKKWYSKNKEYRSQYNKEWWAKNRSPKGL